MPAGWTCVLEVGLASLVRATARQVKLPRNLWRLSTGLGRFQDFGLVDFLVLPRPECQLAGLASPRASVLACLSDGEAGETLVDFLAGSLSGPMDFYEFWVNVVWATARQAKVSPISSGLFLEELGLSGMYVYTKV